MPLRGAIGISVTERYGGDGEYASMLGAARVLNVAHLATRLPVGGMENVVASLLRGMPSTRYRSAVWCLEEADVRGRELMEDGVAVVELQRRRRHDMALFMRVATLARQNRIDILHCHDELSWFYGTIAGSLAGIPRIVTTVHGRRGDISTRHMMEQRFLARRTSAIVSVSKFLRRQLLEQLGLGPDKVIAIPNGIPLPAILGASHCLTARGALGVPDDAIVAASVGELSPVKNLALAIDALAAARREVPALHLVLIGDGALRGELEGQVRSLSLGGFVHFAGVRRDVDRLWPGVDLYVCSSKYEGISLSILEAMAAGLPVIATSVGGNPEIVHHGETGLLTPAGDRGALARALVALADDPARRQRLGRSAQLFVHTAHSLERMIENYGRLYRSLF